MYRALGAAIGIVMWASLARGQTSRDRVSLVFRGEAALQRQELDSAIAAFREASRDTNLRRRAAAERMLALIDWRFLHRYRTADEHFSLALATGEDTAATLVEVARLAAAQHRYREAFDIAARAARAAVDEFAHRGAVLQMAHAVVEPAFVQRVDGGTVPRAHRPDTTAVRAALDELLDLVRATPGRPEESRELLLVALLAGDGPAAAEAVQSYLLVGSGDAATLDSPRSKLVRQLVTWPGSAATTRQRAQLARALLAVQFHEAAGLVAPASSELVAYTAYTRRLSREAEEYYRSALLGDARPQDLTRLYYRASHDLWPRLDWSGREKPPPFYPAAIAPELGRRFGAVVQLGVTGGYYDLHFGHVVSSQRIEIAQYGRVARLRLLVIDGMVSNGLQTWAWDDAGGHGGWQRKDTVVQVRPVFVDHTISLWLTADSARYAREQVNTANDSVADLAIAARDSIAYLPGVAARLRRDGREALLDSLRRSGLTGRALASAFIREAARLSHQSSIIAHEGRHAIDDALLRGASTEEREFRAKLSEIGFSERPKLAFSSIMHPNVGDATPHGRANARIMAGLIRWMRVHAGEIAGLDTTRPPLPQLPLMSDQQLRDAFRWMDPLARDG